MDEERITQLEQMLADPRQLGRRFWDGRYAFPRCRRARLKELEVLTKRIK